MYRKFEILQGTPKERRFQSKLAKTLLYICVPLGLQFSITAIGSIMLQSANNALGTAFVAAFTSAMRIKMFFSARSRVWELQWLRIADRIMGQEQLGIQQYFRFRRIYKDQCKIFGSHHKKNECKCRINDHHQSTRLNSQPDTLRFSCMSPVCSSRCLVCCASCVIPFRE